MEKGWRKAKVDPKVRMDRLDMIKYLGLRIDLNLSFQYVCLDTIALML